jgi:hypothetical protein
MSDRDHAVEALEQLRTMESSGSGESAIEQHRRDAIEQVETLLSVLDETDPTDTSADSVETPDEWDDEELWEDNLETARKKADIAASKGTLTIKTINERDYYYLQWREGQKVRSQYVAPVDPA